MTRIDVEIPDGLATELADMGQQDGKSLQDVVRDVLERVVRMRRIDRLQDKVQASALSDQNMTEQEIFDEIS